MQTYFLHFLTKCNSFLVSFHSCLFQSGQMQPFFGVPFFLHAFFHQHRGWGCTGLFFRVFFVVVVVVGGGVVGGGSAGRRGSSSHAFHFLLKCQSFLVSFDARLTQTFQVFLFFCSRNIPLVVVVVVLVVVVMVVVGGGGGRWSELQTGGGCRGVVVLAVSSVVGGQRRWCHSRGDRVEGGLFEG